MSPPINPRPFLKDLTEKSVSVRLKWGQEYVGKLDSSDSYMNLLMSNTTEFVDSKKTGELGSVFIRCNNVLWIREAPTDPEADTKMSE